MPRRARSTPVPSRRPRRRRSPRTTGWTPWRKVGLLALVAVVAMGAREWVGVGSGVAAGGGSCAIGRVVDGDTIKVSCPGSGTFSARLLGFDTPEVFSPGCASELARGTRATWSLRRRIWMADEVRMEFGGLDRYGRRLTWLYLDGSDVAGAMIAAGLARPYHGGRRQSWCR